MDKPDLDHRTAEAVRLVAEAAEAIDAFGEDELERFADWTRRQATLPKEGTIERVCVDAAARRFVDANVSHIPGELFPVDAAPGDPGHLTVLGAPPRNDCWPALVSVVFWVSDDYTAQQVELLAQRAGFLVFEPSFGGLILALDDSMDRWADHWVPLYWGLGLDWHKGDSRWPVS